MRLQSALVFGIAFGLLFIAQVPFALGTVLPSQAGLGTGLYFGGMSAASAIAQAHCATSRDKAGEKYSLTTKVTLALVPTCR